MYNTWVHFDQWIEFLCIKREENKMVKKQKIFFVISNRTRTTGSRTWTTLLMSVSNTVNSDNTTSVIKDMADSNFRPILGVEGDLPHMFGFW